MIREYFVRGERKTVDEVDDVVAVHVDGAVVAEIAEALADDEELSAFRAARWVFVPASAALVLESAEDAGRLVRRPNGRLGIVTRRLTVQLDEDLSAEAAEEALARRGLTLVRKLGFAPNLFEVDTTEHADSLAASVDLNADPLVTLAEPSLVEHVPPRSDPRFAEQWQWANTGQSGGTIGADAHVAAAWQRTLGAGIRVAVIDNGFNAAHEDLKAGVHPASGFFTRAGTFTAGTTGMPNGDHGTFCAGMVGARRNNALGGTGAAPEADLLLIACLGDQVGTQTTLARAVAYAADPSLEGGDHATGADILVSSLGPNGADWDLTATLALALEFAASKGRDGRGLAIFWAASNGTNVDVLKDEIVSHPDVIAVVRSTREDLEDNAARGPEVELIAPGVDVVSTTGNGGYGKSTGTSFAAPCAAGCAALALSVNPALTRDELRTIMHDTADKIGGAAYDTTGHNDDYGFGRVNAAAAVAAAETAVVP